MDHPVAGATADASYRDAAARCANHPRRPAEACARCGTFVCTECQSPDGLAPMWCQACVDRLPGGRRDLVAEGDLVLASAAADASLIGAGTAMVSFTSAALRLVAAESPGRAAVFALLGLAALAATLVSVIGAILARRFHPRAPPFLRMSNMAVMALAFPIGIYVGVVGLLALRRLEGSIVLVPGYAGAVRARKKVRPARRTREHAGLMVLVTVLWSVGFWLLLVRYLKDLTG